MSRYPDSEPILDAFHSACRRFAERTALGMGPDRLSYEELEKAVAAMAAELREIGVFGSPNDPEHRAHLGILLPNSPDAVVAFYASLTAGALPFLFDPGDQTGELEVLGVDCSLDAILVTTQNFLVVDGLPIATTVPLTPELTICFLERAESRPYKPRPSTRICRFSSGTTGRPKCLEFSGDAVRSAAGSWAVGTGLGPDDKSLCLAALSNGLAFNTSLLATFLVGAELHFLAGLPLSRRVTEAIKALKITRLVAFPTFYRLLVEGSQGFDGPSSLALGNLKVALSAGAPLWPEVRERFYQQFGFQISDYYGIAETGPCTFERDRNCQVGLGSPLPGVQIEIAQEPGRGEVEGEVLVRTDSMASGYLNFPGLFVQRLDSRGFLLSGDQGRWLDGKLVLCGRQDLRINAGGRKIDPEEVVAVALALEPVRDAVAFADSATSGETVVHLALSLAAPLTRSEVVAAYRRRTAAFKVPARISFVDRIPRNGVGKPKLALLKESLSGLADSRQ